MRKLLLTIVLLFMTTLSFAGAVIPKQLQVKPDVLIADNPNQSGTVYNGKIAILNGGAISLNRNYINSILIVKQLDGSYITRFFIGYLRDQNYTYYCPNLPTEFQGKVGRVAYKTWTDARKAWQIQQGSGIAIFEGTGVILNADKLVYEYNADGTYVTNTMGTCKSKVNGIYPVYGVILDIKLTAAEQASFKPELDAWKGNIPVTERTATVGDGTR